MKTLSSDSHLQEEIADFRISYADIPLLMYVLDDEDYFSAMPREYRKFVVRLWAQIQNYRYDVEHKTNYSGMNSRTSHPKLAQLESEVERLREALGEKILLRARNYLERQRNIVYRPYNAGEFEYLYFGIEAVTDHLLENFKARRALDGAGE